MDPTALDMSRPGAFANHIRGSSLLPPDDRTEDDAQRLSPTQQAEPYQVGYRGLERPCLNRPRGVGFANSL